MSTLRRRTMRLLLGALTVTTLIAVTPLPASAAVYSHIRNRSTGTCLADSGPGTLVFMGTCNNEWNTVFDFTVAYWSNGSAVYQIRSRNGNCLWDDQTYLWGGNPCLGTDGDGTQLFTGITQPNGTLVFVNVEHATCITAENGYARSRTCSTWTNGVSGTANQQSLIY